MERALRALQGEPVDRPAAITPTSVVNVELMDYSESPFPEAHRDPEKMTALAETGHTVLSYDTIMPVFTIIQESVALGCEVEWAEKDNWATCRGRLAVRPEDLKFPKDYLRHEACSCVLESLRELKRRHPDVLIIGKTMGPWTLGYHFFGTQDFLLMTIDDPDATMRALHILKEITVEFGLAQIQAGADVLTLPDHATGDLVSAEYYRRFLFDIHCELAERIPCPLIMHICGRTVDRMPDIGRTGFDAFHFDSKNLPDESLDAIGSKVRLVGNVNNPKALFTGAPEAAYAETVRALDAGVPAVGPECAVPLRAPTENLKAISRAATEFPELSLPDREEWRSLAEVYG